jgi:hypothetical protein
MDLLTDIARTFDHVLQVCTRTVCQHGPGCLLCMVTGRLWQRVPAVVPVVERRLQLTYHPTASDFILAQEHVRKKAVVIAVTQGDPRLHTSGQAFVEFLTKGHSFVECRFLSDALPDPTRHPTYVNISKALLWLFQLASSGDSLVVVYVSDTTVVSVDQSLQPCDVARTGAIVLGTLPYLHATVPGVHVTYILDSGLSTPQPVGPGEVSVSSIVPLNHPRDDQGPPLVTTVLDPTCLVSVFLAQPPTTRHPVPRLTDAIRACSLKKSRRVSLRQLAADVRACQVDVVLATSSHVKPAHYYFCLTNTS